MAINQLFKQKYKPTGKEYNWGGLDCGWSSPLPQVKTKKLHSPKIFTKKIPLSDQQMFLHLVPERKSKDQQSSGSSWGRSCQPLWGCASPCRPPPGRWAPGGGNGIASCRGSVCASACTLTNFLSLDKLGHVTPFEVRNPFLLSKNSSVNRILLGASFLGYLTPPGIPFKQHFG